MSIQKLLLKDIYSTDQTTRYGHIIKKFEELYSHKPQIIVRAPGRVNLIGEHIDYEGYGVLPFAIQKDCVIVARIIEEDTLYVSHIDKMYPPAVLPSSKFEEVKYSHPYLQYFYAGYMAGVREVSQQEGTPETIRQLVKGKKYKGMQILVEGNVPIASGLSSSSSFCVCAAVLSSVANGFSDFVKKQVLIEQIIKYERMVGTACGGMDQSISVLGVQQGCLYIQFNPIRGQPVALPAGYKFVIMNSLEQSKKLETIGTRYNKRVCECQIAVRMLSNKLNIPLQISNGWIVLKQVQDYLGVSLASMSSLVDQFIEKKPYSRSDIQKEIGEPLDKFLQDVAASHIVIECNKEYAIYEAAKHVFDQAGRVLKFVEVCASKLQSDSKAKVLGKLMNESQASCKNLYHCSSQLIDEVTSIALQEGALGSRLTGAGWGGCTISMVPQNKVEHFIERMKTRFYAREQFKKQVEQLGIQNIIFETTPVAGASLVQLE